MVVTSDVESDQSSRQQRHFSARRVPVTKSNPMRLKIITSPSNATQEAAATVKMSPTLHIRSPSSTTTEFTVTTRPPPSLRRTITSFIVALLRVIAFVTVTVLLLSQHSLLPARLRFLQLPPLDPRALYPLSVATLWIIAQRGYTEESLLVIRSLGVQTSTTAGTWVGMGRRTRFIPTEKVRDIIVNEGFVGMEVRFYVAVVVEGEGSLVVVFPVGLSHLEDGNLDDAQCSFLHRRCFRTGGAVNWCGEARRGVCINLRRWRAAMWGHNNNNTDNCGFALACIFTSQPTPWCGLSTIQIK
jgi:phosphatidylinositol glycan class H protein